MSELLRKVDGEDGSENDVLLYIGQFSGGARRGPCIQLTLVGGTDPGVVQLTEENVRRLSKAIDQWLFRQTLRKARNKELERAKRD